MTGGRVSKQSNSEKSTDDLSDKIKAGIDLALSSDTIINSIKQALQSKEIISAIISSIVESVTKTVAENVSSLIEDQKRHFETINKQQGKKIDDLEQYQRRNNIRIFGVPEEERENTDNIVINIASDMGMKIDYCDIDRSHRVGKPDNYRDKARPIIVKFVSYRTRAAFFQRKRNMKGSGVTIREDLTATRLKLLNDAIAKHTLKNVWTMDGNIVVLSGKGSPHQRKHVITDVEGLIKIPMRPPQDDPAKGNPPDITPPIPMETSRPPTMNGISTK